MKRLLLSLMILSSVACDALTDASETPITTSIMIVGAALAEPTCDVSASSDRLVRGIYDIKGVDSTNGIGKQYTANLIVRDQTQTGVGSKKLIVEYDFTGNLVQPTAATRNALRECVELGVPFGGWTQGDDGQELLVVTSPVIPEHVTQILANDPAISAELNRTSTTMNTVSGLPGYYTVQVKIQALSLGLNGQWLRSPPYFMTVDLCDGCLTRIPEQLVPDQPDPTCIPYQDRIWQKLTYPEFPDLTAKTEGPLNDGDLNMPLETVNQGGTATLGSFGATRGGRSKSAIWLVTPNHDGKTEFTYAGLQVAERNPYATCGVNNVVPGESEKCLVPTYPRVCEDGRTPCSKDEDCNGGSCTTAPSLRVTEEPGFTRQFACGTPSENTNTGGGGDAGPGADGGLPPPAADGGLPVVACLYIVCADVDNEVLEWSPDPESWESAKSNCTCYSEDSDLAEDGCPL